MGTTDASAVTRPMHRRNIIVVRILLLIDLMASRRMPIPVDHIAHLINERTGDPVSLRTIRRDLQALHEIGLVDRVRLPRGRGRAAFGWRLSLQRSESHQRSAMEIDRTRNTETAN